MTVRIETLAEGVTLYCGDCIPAMQSLAPNSVDACVTDPPYGLSFMGKAWDHGVPGIAYWKEVFRVLKPGAHLLAFGGTRTFGRMHVAIEDAGFEIRDMISWLYGSGFPKSLDVSKAIDKAAGAERDVVRERYTARPIKPGATVVREGAYGKQDISFTACDTAPATDDAAQWQGFGTALKPACEPIVLARKPLSESTVAANVLKWGTGALNIDGSRIAAGDKTPAPVGQYGRSEIGPTGHNGARNGSADSLGRWPANVIHDGSEEVVGAFPDNLKSGTGSVKKATSDGHQGTVYGKENRAVGTPNIEYGDEGSAARFFYTAKADADDRLGSKHPTVKPLDLMQYLVRLVTPPKGLVLDPFAGTGTTAEACIRERMRCIVIEREGEYQNDIRRRIGLAMSGTDTRKRAAAAERNKDKPVDMGPLFGGMGDTPPADRAGRFTATSPIRTNDWPDGTQVVNK